MFEYTFETTINDDGTLNCPKEFSFKDAQYKVSVTVPDFDDIKYLSEIAALTDTNEDFLSKDELEYYISLI